MLHHTYLIIIITLLVFQLISFFLIFRLFKFYRFIASLSPKQQTPLPQLLTGLQTTLVSHEKKLDFHDKQIAKLLTHTSYCFDKILLKRFNPFSHTGGKQSFLLAFLDSHLNGLLLTFLHTRENTRFYVKSIKEGKGVEFPLAPEEENLIKTARKPR